MLIEIGGYNGIVSISIAADDLPPKMLTMEIPSAKHM